MPDQLTINSPITTTTTGGNLKKASLVGGLLAVAALGLNVSGTGVVVSPSSTRAVAHKAAPFSFVDPSSIRKRKSGFSQSGILNIPLDNTYNNQISSHFLVADHMKTLIERVDSFSGLEEGWDGYDADTVEREVINNAISFLTGMPNYYVNFLSEFSLMPTNYGTIIVEWSAADNSFVSVEVGYDQIAYFCNVHGRKWASEQNMRINSGNYTEHIVSALTRLYSPNLV